MATRKTIRRNYGSFAELLDASRKHRDAYTSAHPETTPEEEPHPWTGANTWEQVDRWAAEGWEDGVKEATEISEEALRFIDAETPVETFKADWDVTGCEVDVGTYLQGIPECMIEYEPVRVSRAGKVVTICVSASFSASMSVETLIRRAVCITGLVKALEERQHSTEIWLDNTVTTSNGYMRVMRCLVKSAADSVPVAELAFQLGHPAVLRRVIFAERHMDARLSPEFDASKLHGAMPHDPLKDLPEGTIYFSAVSGSHDLRDPEGFIRRQLKELGLVE